MAQESTSHPPAGGRGNAKGKRAYTRRPQNNLESSLGPVLDLSAGGMRIIAKRELKGIVDVSLSGGGIDQTVRARVIWTKKAGFRVYEVGLAFVDVHEVRQLVEWLSKWGTPKSAA